MASHVKEYIVNYFKQIQLKYEEVSEEMCNVHFFMSITERFEDLCPSYFNSEYFRSTGIILVIVRSYHKQINLLQIVWPNQQEFHFSHIEETSYLLNKATTDFLRDRS